MILAGITIVKPAGYGDALLALINKYFELSLPLSGPRWLGLSLIVAGVSLCAWGETRRRAHSIVIAFRHHSLEPFAAQLRAADLPSGYQACEIRNIDCDISAYFKNGSCDPVGAIRRQLESLSDLRSVRGLLPSAAVAYYGLAHIPLQFLAGCNVSTHSPFLLFELDRQTSVWRPLGNNGPKLFPSTTLLRQPTFPQAIAIRICISYEVTAADMEEVLRCDFEDIRIGLATPRIDAVSSVDQVNEVCDRFRRVLDDIHARHAKSIPVHVFYAGPASLGFSLGRQISRTVHHRVIVHNYMPSSEPKYSWAVEVTSSGPPDAMVNVQQELEVRE